MFKNQVTTKVWSKIIACMLVITLTFANIILLGIVTGEGIISYALGNLEGQNRNTQNANVEFDTYFQSEGNISHSLISNVKETPNLYVYLNVKNKGFLKNAKVEFKNQNYEIKGNVENSDIVQNITESLINLKEIACGTEATLEIPIGLNIQEKFDISNINKESSLILKGTYITGEGKEVAIEKEININLKWESKTTINVDTEISKYIVLNTEKEIVIQEIINVNKEEKTLPINKTTLEIDVPQIANIAPTSIIVTALKTEMTNGEKYETVGFTNSNWNYNETTKKLTIKVENNNIWAGLGEDIYRVTYIYGENAYNAKQSENEITTKTIASVETYNYSGTVINKAEKGKEITLTEEIGQLISGNVVFEEKILKGNMYANYNSNNRTYETAYNIKEIIEINKIDGINNIEIKNEENNFVDSRQNKYSTIIEGINYTYNKSLAINKANFEDILGEDGEIIILNNAGEEIAKINKATTEKNGNYVVKFETKQEEISLKTTAPIKTGNLIINKEKAIKADLPYSKEQVQAFEKLNVSLTVVTSNSESSTMEESIPLEETETRVNLSLNKNNITEKTENVEFKIELNNNNSKSDLYNEPVFSIVLPSFINNAEIEKTSILFDEELKIKKSEVLTNNDGNKVLKIWLEGVQTVFNTIPNVNGTTIVIGTTLYSNEPGKDVAKLIVENNNARKYSENSQTEALITMQANKITQNVAASQETGAGTTPTNSEEEDLKNRLSLNILSIRENDIIEAGMRLQYSITATNITKDGIFTQLTAEQEEEIDSLQLARETRELTQAELKRLQELYNLKDTISNVVIKDVLPEGVKFEKAYILKYNTTTKKDEEIETGVTYNEKTREVKWLVDDLIAKGETRRVYVSVIAEKLVDVSKKEIENYATVTYKDSNRIVSNTIKNTIAAPELKIVKTSENLLDVNKVGDEIKFIVNVTNTGLVEQKDFSVEINVPENLEVTTLSYGTVDAEETDTNNKLVTMSYSENKVKVPITEIGSNKLAVISVTAKIKAISKTEEGQYITSKVTANIQNSEIVWNVKVKNPNYNSGIEEEPTNGEKSKINGVAWIDEDGNGIKEETEDLANNIKVTLIDLSNNNVVKTTTTNEYGKYEFTEIENGNYQVQFEYDQAKYYITEYKKTDNEETNSNAIKVDGGKAVTNTIKILDANIKNVNIGLVKIPKFDLSIEKTISKIVVQNNEGTKTYEYNTQLAKIDINKKYVNGTTLLIEYKIVVKNEGELAGKVKKIVDYMPKDTVFTSDLNTAWVQLEDGNLYNSELKNISINPGETKEIKLILKKTVTENNTGITNNTAELYEVENEKNIKDVDSTPNNRVQKEDDMSSANVIVSIKTGQEVVYTTLTLVCMIILAVGIYIINKKVLVGTK